MSKVLFICPYPPDRAPSQRFRFEQYLGHLNNEGSLVVIRSFFSEKAYKFYHSGKLLPKVRAITLSYINCSSLFLHALPFDFIFIHREACPLGPPLIEWVLARILRKKIIYDFDDAIWLTDKQDEHWLVRLLRWRTKVALISKWSYTISCGNEYLADYARQFNPRVVVNPTTIDTNNLHIPQVTSKFSGKTTIGWTGSNSTLKYLKTLVPVLQALEKKYPELQFLVIADVDPKLPLNNASFRPWRKGTEIRDLAAIDIGIMPLPDDPWTRGKCGFKALQYMALQIAPVVSPVGVNSNIVQHGVEGYLCSSHDEWFRHLEELILCPQKRIQMGKLARRKVIDRYSVNSNRDNFLSLFQ